MKKTMSYECRKMMALAAGAAALLMTGCAGMNTASTATGTPLTGAVLHGSVYGGRQPIAGATLYLYAAGTSGYGAANTNLLPTGTMTLSDGTFNITSLYSCTAGQQMYLVALGGNTGGATANPQSGIMAALGDCANLNGNTFIQMNEVTTVGSVFALAPFMKGYSALGAPTTNNAGLVRAFNSVNKLVSISGGSPLGTVTPANATALSEEISSLADVIASCVDSTGGMAGDGTTNCGILFSLVTPSGGTAPTNTIDATLLIAQNPANNAGPIFARMPAQNPYNPVLPAPPTDWTMSLVYAPAGLASPRTTTVDANNQVWVADATNSSLTVLSQSGTVANTITGNGLSGPVAVAIDNSGNAWVANSTGHSVSAFTSSGGTFGSSPFNVGTGATPAAVAIDASGQVFVADGGTNNVAVLSSTGTAVTTITSGVSSPTALVIDPK